MTAVEINTINNQYLREAAEAADTQGENAYNKKLDSNELTVFMQNAVESGKCSIQDLMDVMNKVGVDKNDKEIQTKINELEQINKLKNEICRLKNELSKNEKILFEKEVKPNTIQTLAGFGGIFAGVGAGVKIGGAISTALSATGVGAAVVPFIMVGSGLIGGALGALGMYKAADYAQRPFESHETTVQRKQADDYKETNVEPLKAQIKELEKALEEKLENFGQ